MNVYKIGGIVIPSVGVASLAKVNAEAGYQVRVFDENVMGRVVDGAGRLRKDILDNDVLGVSMLTPSAPRGCPYKCSFCPGRTTEKPRRGLTL